ncbi:hypothetical protein [Kerstersia gyiorum]|jgi:hypothetical protein|uniref:hypothetical protein n=1 Tax=Kerstersia gyiorum TaxID=206506 RepID=UPI00242B2703|nr:hypothetical protein [Kerstersia gyiorum]MCH4271785.1 hypothetical protein [Kerstersia gyiorum]MCI1227646.1 hypothetical protein [Kerstersia gyiorum]
MSIKIYNNRFENCGTGISAPADADVDIGANSFIACGKAIDLRGPESLLGFLGLKNDTPLHVLREVLCFVGKAQRTELEIQDKADSAGLFSWLSVGADTTTLVSGLASLYEHVPKILAALGG